MEPGKIPPVIETPAAKAAQSRRTWRGTALRMAGIAVPAAMLFWLAVLSQLERSEQGPLPPIEVPAPVAVDQVQSAPPNPSTPAEPLRQALEGIVVIHSNDDIGNATLGAGFVVDEEGLVATNYHVIAEATEAKATFQNGASYEIAGYVAVKPEGTWRLSSSASRRLPCGRCRCERTRTRPRCRLSWPSAIPRGSTSLPPTAASAE